MKLTRQEMIDERDEIAEKLMAITHKSGEGTDMKEYARLQDRYHWLDEKIRKGKK